MGRKKDPEATLRRAREKGYERNTAIVNNNAVLKKLEPQAEELSEEAGSMGPVGYIIEVVRPRLYQNRFV